MFTGNDTKPTVHTFKAPDKDKYKATIHYELANGKPLLGSSKINISKDRQCANSNPSYWLKIREANKWSNNITGLFLTKEKSLFRGDHNKRKSLILFRFSDKAETLTVFFFEGFYTGDLNQALKQIQ
jgi:hypothetical protein